MGGAGDAVAGSLIRSRENFTAAAVSGSPLWKITPLRRWKIHEVVGVLPALGEVGDDLHVFVDLHEIAVDLPDHVRG